MIVQSMEQLVSNIERNKTRRKSKVQFSFILIAVLTLFLIWSTDVPDWLTDVSPYIFLQFILMMMTYVWILGDAQKNEELLLDELKRYTGKDLDAEM